MQEGKHMNAIKHIFWNGGQSRVRTGFRVILLLVIFMVFYKGYIFLLTSFGVKLFYSSSTDLWVFLIAGTVRIFPVVLTLYICGRFIDRRKIREFGLHMNRQWWIDFSFGMGLGALLLLLIFLVQAGLGWVSISDWTHTINPQSMFIVPFLVFLFYIFCQALFEELLGRGYLLKNLSEGFNLKKISSKRSVLLAWFLVSIIFGLSHIGNPNANLVSTLNLIMSGFTFGAGMVLTGELAIPIGLHFSWNFFQGNVFGFPISGISYPAEVVSLVKIEQSGPAQWTGGAFGPEAGLLGLIADFLGLIFIFLWVQRRQKKRLGEIHEPLADSPNHKDTF